MLRGSVLAAVVVVVVVVDCCVVECRPTLGRRGSGSLRSRQVIWRRKG